MSMRSFRRGNDAKIVRISTAQCNTKDSSKWEQARIRPDQELVKAQLISTYLVKVEMLSCYSKKMIFVTFSLS